VKWRFINSYSGQPASLTHLFPPVHWPNEECKGAGDRVLTRFAAAVLRYNASAHDHCDRVDGRINVTLSGLITSTAVRTPLASRNESPSIFGNVDYSGSVLPCPRLQGSGTRMVTKPEIEDLVFQGMTITAIEKLNRDLLSDCRTSRE
jgi:hypothetical protein